MLSKLKYCVSLWRIKNAVDRARFRIDEPNFRRKFEQEIHDDCIKAAQGTQLPNLHQKLTQRVAPPKEFRDLRPFLDPNGLIRVNGRLRQATWLTYDQRHPIILPKQGKVTFSIVKAYHVRILKHVGGVEMLLSRLREKYWVVRARVLCKHIIQECNHCNLRHQRLTRPEMAPIHPSRIDVVNLKPFKSIGVDMAGPITTKPGPGTRKQAKIDLKRYFIIFSCTITRAIHLEMVDTADAESFLMSFERFTSHYGVPDTIYSDQGGNFVKADKELKAISQEWNGQRIRLSNRYPIINWKFSPPYSPNWGGHYERMIGVTKRALVSLLQSRQHILSDEQLRTLLAMVKGIINGRPLTVVSSGANDWEVLTPDHFLKTGKNPTYLYGTPLHQREQLGHRYKCLLDIIDHYWKRFLKQYIPTLHRVEKWQDGTANLQVDDVVLVLEPGLGRGEWPLGRIVQIYPGSDGKVRSADVEVAESQYDSKGKRLVVKKTIKKRSVSTLCPLNL